MTKYTEHFNTRETSQREQADPNQVVNSAGGYSFAVDEFTRLNRFLVLGSEGGTYYIGEKQLTIENAKNIQKCLDSDPVRAINLIADVSFEGRAPKNDPALFALAVAAGHTDQNVRDLALQFLPRIARTGTHLFQFVDYVQAFRGWGRGLRRTVQNWYLTMPLDKLALQVVKYKQREGWSHKDVLRLSHPSSEGDRALILKHAAGKLDKDTPLIGDSQAINLLRADINIAQWAKADVIKAIIDYNLPREIIPTQLLIEADVWEALLQNMPMTAMIRNLGKMSAIGLLGHFSQAAQLVSERLNDADRLKKARIHPLQILGALGVYSSGSGLRGGLNWEVNDQIVHALNDAFYLSFGAIEPTGKNHLLAVDVSGSMGWNSPMTGVTCCMAAAAMSMVALRTEQNSIVRGFAGNFVDLKITAKDSLDSAVNKAERNNFGTTNCALPMEWALKTKTPIDAFVVYTDNETYAGRIHPHQALVKYREKTGIAAKLIVVGMVSNNFTIADPNDAGMLDVVGFSTEAPQVMSDFVRG